MLNPPPELVAGMLADPDDDTPRLAVADWFDEQGHPERARLIRVQCRLADRYARLTLAERDALEAEARLLLRRHAAAWLGDSRWLRRGPEVVWGRGFPVAAHLRAERHFGWLARLPLLETVHLSVLPTLASMTDALGRLGNLREVQGYPVPELALPARPPAHSRSREAWHLTPADVWWVRHVGTPVPPTLVLIGEFSAGDLPRGQSLHSVVRLNLFDFPRLDPDLLAAMPNLRGLTLAPRHALRHWRPAFDAIAALAPSLERLYLKGFGHDAVGLARLLAALPRLRSLEFEPDAVTPEHWSALRASGSLREVRIWARTPVPPRLPENIRWLDVIPWGTGYRPPPLPPPVPVRLPTGDRLRIPAHLEPADPRPDAGFADAEFALGWAEPDFPDYAPGVSHARATLTLTAHRCDRSDRPAQWLAERYVPLATVTQRTRRGLLADGDDERARLARAWRVGGRMFALVAQAGAGRLYPWGEAFRASVGA